MIPSKLRGSIATLLLASLTAAAWGADDTRTQTGKVTPAPRPTTSKSGASARGILPDPVLLDGSTQPAEKKTEFGMIGDFELPGDETRSGRVGGPQMPGQQMPGQQQQQGGGGMPMGLPQAGGAGGQQQAQQQPPPGAQGGGQQGPAGAENPNAAGNPVAGAGDPNAKPEGVQVAQLGGENGPNQPGGAAGEKPPPVAIGDSAMRIQTPPAQAGVVGAQGQQLPGNTQHHEKGTGSGGKGPTGAQGNNRVEKGRTIPAGL